MIDVLSQIESGNWSLLATEDGFGAIIQGISEVNQTIGLILLTEKGSDPFRPTFGSDIYDHISKPIPLAATGITRAIVDSVNRWEPRVDVISVTYKTQPQFGTDQSIPAGLIFTITWKFKSVSNQQFLNILVGTDGQNTNNIIRILGTEDGFAVSTESNQVIPI